MKNIIAACIILFTGIYSASAQYNREKITGILTGNSEKLWNINGINVDRPERSALFNINGNAVIELSSGKKNNEKWTLMSADNIRWFISIGNNKYELIISYDKKGNQYIKLTHQENKTSDYYEIKLTSAK
jgi:hypothetical protein